MILEEARIGERAFSSLLSALEIDVFFTLCPEEITAVCDQRRDLNRLGLALHLCVVKMIGRAELSAKMVPQASNLERIAEPQRTIELARFVKHRLEVLTDGAIDLFNHLVNDIAPRSGPRNPHRGTAGISFADAGRAV